ncbi:pilus assembly protein PilC [candidate division LCP-89 bacterium B3_LCP]|uniref:Pilus assembly protein PilC n=1 Tax=candidate division LCP-89 bacterium B3_LCP TaxID=2012998 RepID=A0A532UYD6_UNCL8|nr:MAG: pilus assembly protein PilC [candidate division LCP-89 bacterium B3_LCP]
MPNFAYVIKDTAGNKLEDYIRAANVEAAMESLRRKGAEIISIREVKSEFQAERLTIAEQINLFFFKLRTHVPLSILVFFTRQLATMFSAGLTIEKSIANLMFEERNKKFRKVLAQVGNDLKKGMALSDSMANHPGVFSNLYVALVRAGEISGSLHVTLEHLSNYLESIAETRRKVISAMAYPVFSLCFLILILTVLLVYIVPLFQDVYEKFGAQLPIATRTLIAVSKVISNNFPLTVGIVFLFIVVIWLISMTERGGLIMDSIKLRFPVFGSLLTNSVMNKFSKTFGVLLGAGVPVLDSLSQIQKVVGNKVIEKGIRESKVLIKDGFAISVAMKKSQVFPPTLVQLTATGEETGEIDALLDKAAEFYEKQLDAIVDRLTSLIEPLLIVLIGSVVLVIIIALYLPIFYLGMAMRSGL